ncbi:MAG: rhomboid family intramembrane serine protease [Haloarculaceae archaeon]
MSNCDVCGKQENMPYRCRHCGGTFCAEHRLPENHDCPGLDNWGDPDGVFDSGFDDSVRNRGGGSPSVTDRLKRTVSGLTGPGGPLAYFRGNMTYVFLGLMVVTFLLQTITSQFLDRATYEAIFVLTPQHPLYVWTWFTSIFAHGGPGHLFVNAIVIFFFGRIVEQYVGSRKFAALFLASGALAGLGQILIQIVQHHPQGVIGASGAGLAIMGVLTVLNPNLRVYIWFILPVPIWLVTAFYFVISIGGVFGLQTGFGAGNVADAAHLVGLLIGLWYGNRVKGRRRAPQQLQMGAGRGPGGPGGPGRGRGPF